MPVTKYRDVSEMPDSRWRRAGDPGLLEAIRSVWHFARRTTDPRFPPGVHKHRSIEEAEALRDVWEEANFIRLRERRDKERER